MVVGNASVQGAAKRREALSQLFQLLAIGGGVGAAGAAMTRLGQRTPSWQKALPGPSVPVRIPVPAAMAPEEEQDPLRKAGMLAALPVLWWAHRRRQRKKAVNAPPKKPPAKEPVAEPAEKRAASTVAKPDAWQQAADALIPTPTTTRALGDWWGPSAAVLASGAGLLGGWKGTNALFRTEQAVRREDELQDAERDYRKALADEYAAAMRAKRGEDGLGIDELFDMLSAVRDAPAQKEAALEDPWRTVAGTDLWQGAKGGLLATMLLTGLGSGYITHSVTRANSREKALTNALRLRARMRQATSPPPLRAELDPEQPEPIAG